MQSRTLMARRHIRQSMCGFYGEDAEDIHNQDQMPQSNGNVFKKRSSSLALARHAAAGAASTAHRIAIGADGKIYGSEMTAATFAIRFAARHARYPVSIDANGRILHDFGFTHTQILIDDIATKSSCRHAVDLEQTQLILVDSHLYNGIINHHTQPGMKPNLKRFAAHKNIVRINRVTRQQYCGNGAVMATCKKQDLSLRVMIFD